MCDGEMCEGEDGECVMDEGVREREWEVCNG